MIRRRIPQSGDVYWVNPNPVAGREMKDRHRFVVITPKEINALGVAMLVPITSCGAAMRETGLTVALSGHDTNGVRCVIKCARLTSTHAHVQAQQNLSRH